MSAMFWLDFPRFRLAPIPFFIVLLSLADGFGRVAFKFRFLFVLLFCHMNVCIFNGKWIRSWFVGNISALCYVLYLSFFCVILIRICFTNESLCREPFGILIAVQYSMFFFVVDSNFHPIESWITVLLVALSLSFSLAHTRKIHFTSDDCVMLEPVYRVNWVTDGNEWI